MAKIYFSVDLDPQDIKALGDVVSSTLDKLTAIDTCRPTGNAKPDTLDNVRDALCRTIELAKAKLESREVKEQALHNTASNSQRPNNNCKVKKK